MSLASGDGQVSISIGVPFHFAKVDRGAAIGGAFSTWVEEVCFEKKGGKHCVGQVGLRRQAIVQRANVCK